MPNRGDQSRPDPGGSADATAFVAELNQLRQLARDTYKDLQRKTGIPTSTLCDILTHKRRPRDEVVRAVVGVYAADGDQAAGWIARWDSFVLASVRDSDSVDAPPDAAPGPGTDARTNGATPAGAAPATSLSRPVVPVLATRHVPPVLPGSDLVRPELVALGLVEAAPLGYRTLVGWRPAQLVVLAVLMIAAAIGGGAFVALTGNRDGGGERTVAGEVGSTRSASTTLVVFNVETACQPLRAIECGLSVVRDPRVTGASNIITRVFHGDSLNVICVIEDGRLIADESGVSSRRWYKVIVPDTTEVGWFPGVRTRNLVEIARC